MEQFTEAVKVEDLTANLEIKIISKNGRVQTRELSQAIKSVDGCDNCYNTLIRFEAPSDVKNTGVLILEYEDKVDDQWLYMPALRRSRRISANNQKDRFMGTEFTYEDISNELSEKLDEYTYKLIKTEDKQGRKCYVVEALPQSEREKKVSGYSKRYIWVDVENFVVMYSEFYDKDGDLLKFIKREDIRQVGDSDYYRAYMAWVVNVQTKNKTELIYSYVEIDQGLDEAFFTKRNLEKTTR